MLYGKIKIDYVMHIRCYLITSEIEGGQSKFGGGYAENLFGVSFGSHPQIFFKNWLGGRGQKV